VLLQIVGRFRGATHTYTPKSGVSIVWPKGLPIDMPACGYVGELCIEKPGKLALLHMYRHCLTSYCVYCNLDHINVHNLYIYEGVRLILNTMIGNVALTMLFSLLYSFSKLFKRYIISIEKHCIFVILFFGRKKRKHMLFPNNFLYTIL